MHIFHLLWLLVALSQPDIIQYPVPDSLDHLVPGLDPLGVDLLAVRLALMP